MFGLAAAPEMATAVPSEMPPDRSPYVPVTRYFLHAVPLCSAVTVNGSALRSCHASFFEETMFNAMLTTWNGRQEPSCGWTEGHRLAIRTLSLSSKPVKGFRVFSRPGL